MHSKSTSQLIRTVQTEAPTTGATVTASSARHLWLVINPAGTIAALTINFAGSPSSGDEVTISATQIVTAVTMGNGTVVGAVTSLAVGSFARYVYHTSLAEWIRTG